MLKDKAVASLGQQTLLMPAWITAALAANDRLKLYLSLTQAAAQHARKPEDSIGNWSQELARAGLRDAGWTQDLVRHAYNDEGMLVLSHMPQLLQALGEDLQIMARPVVDGGMVKDASGFEQRRNHWLELLQSMHDHEGLTQEALTALTHGERKAGDSFHLLVMDLHKQINALASSVATENLDDAHVWNIQKDDRALVRAFMRGLHRTAPLKFNHPGLDTAVTRDGKRLLIQNDIGTNDAHVLVIEVEEQTIRLTYSDLHPPRFKFFQSLLENAGFVWKVSEPVISRDLNEGKPYTVGIATLQAADQTALEQGLEDIASRIVFVIDWNRARKRLQMFVSKAQAISILEHTSEHRWGHMGWLLAGGESLVYDTMEAVGSDTFRIGERLDAVLGETGARAFLIELLHNCSELLQQQQPLTLVQDKARLLLGRVLPQRHVEFDLLAEHAAFCHALAQTLCDVLTQGCNGHCDQVVQRAKNWEHRADHLLATARQRAERQPHWRAVVDLLVQADNVADALEESAFIYTLTLVEPINGLPPSVMEVLGKLADTTLVAIQDLVKAIEIARLLDAGIDTTDSDAFLQILWRMLRAERLCDDLLRTARQHIVQTLHAQPAAMLLATELATTIEGASDALVATGYALRQMAFLKTGVPA